MIITNNQKIFKKLLCHHLTFRLGCVTKNVLGKRLDLASISRFWRSNEHFYWLVWRMTRKVNSNPLPEKIFLCLILLVSQRLNRWWNSENLILKNLRQLLECEVSLETYLQALSCGFSFEKDSPNIYYIAYYEMIEWTAVSNLDALFCVFVCQTFLKFFLFATTSTSQVFATATSTFPH